MKSKTETLNEFLSRGGQVQKLPYRAPEPAAEPVRVPTSNHNLLSLGEGELLYSEIKRTGSRKKLLSIVDNFDLPKDVVERLKKGCNE